METSQPSQPEDQKKREETVSSMKKKLVDNILCHQTILDRLDMLTNRMNYMSKNVPHNSHFLVQGSMQREREFIEAEIDCLLCSIKEICF